MSLYIYRTSAEKADSEQAAIRTAEKLLRVRCTSMQMNAYYVRVIYAKA